jgi:hypothetical protein
MPAIPTRGAGVIYASEFLLMLLSAISASLPASQEMSCLRAKKWEECTQLDFWYIFCPNRPLRKLRSYVHCSVTGQITTARASEGPRCHSLLSCDFIQTPTSFIPSLSLVLGSAEFHRTTRCTPSRCAPAIAPAPD